MNTGSAETPLLFLLLCLLGGSLAFSNVPALAPPPLPSIISPLPCKWPPCSLLSAESYSGASASGS